MCEGRIGRTKSGKQCPNSCHLWCATPALLEVPEGEWLCTRCDKNAKRRSEKIEMRVKDGTNGIDGRNGKDGKNGKDGINGAKGNKGDQGQQGVPGRDALGNGGRELMSAMRMNSTMALSAFSTLEKISLAQVTSRPSFGGMNPPPTTTTIAASTVEDWDVCETVRVLNTKGYHSYAAHFEEEQYNGAILLEINEKDIEGMPEKSSLKQRSFFKYVTNLQEEHAVL